METIRIEKYTNKEIGSAIIFCYALYGSYISALLIARGGKGGLPSPDTFFYVIVFFLFILSNFGLNLLLQLAKANGKSLVIFFIFFMMIKIVFLDDDRQTYYLTLISKYMVPNLIAGFIAYTGLRSITARQQAAVHTRHRARLYVIITVASTVVYLAMLLFFIKLFVGHSLFAGFEFKSISNANYQIFGDYLSIVYCCLLFLQISAVKYVFTSDGAFFVFVILLVIQSVLAFICLQAVASNKSVLFIVLCSAFTIYACMPKKWVNIDRFFNINTMLLVAIVIAAGFYVYQYIPAIDVTQYRIFGYGKSTSMVENHSMQTRWEIISTYGREQFLSAPLVGDLTIQNYIHSSLLSTQTHMGAIGLVLLWTYLGIQLVQLFKHAGNECLKVIAVSILFMSIISEFFSWGPLWFLIGALFEYEPGVH